MRNFLVTLYHWVCGKSWESILMDELRLSPDWNKIEGVWMDNRADRLRVLVLVAEHGTVHRDWFLHAEARISTIIRRDCVLRISATQGRPVRDWQHGTNRLVYSRA